MRANVLLALVVLLTPLVGATPAQDVSGHIVASSLTLAGRGSFSSAAGGAVAIQEGTVELALTNGTGFVYESEGVQDGLLRSSHSLRTTRAPVDVGGSHLTIECSVDCIALFVAGEHGTLGRALTLDGALGRASRPVEFTSLVNQPDVPDNFYYRAPNGTIIMRQALETVSPTGELTLFVDNARVHAGDEVWELGSFTEVNGGVSGAPFIARTQRHRFLVLEVEVAQWGATVSTLYAPNATLTLDGEVTLARATGDLVIAGRLHELRDESLALGGVFDLRLGTVEDRKVVTELNAPAWFDLGVDGEASRVRIGAETLSARSAPAVPAWTFAAVLTALLAILLLVPWTPLYSRLDRSRVLQNDTRQRLLDQLRAAPGLTAPALGRELGVARAVVLHHLSMLEAHKLVVPRRVGWERRYYLPEATPDAATLGVAGVLEDATRRRVAEQLVARGPATQADIMAALGLQQRLVSYHLGKLEKAGFVSGSDGRPRVFVATVALRDALALQGVALPGAGASSA